MEHDEAEKSQAVERYLLGELPVTEREAFEEHYFSCPECAEEVRAGLLLQANAAGEGAEDDRLVLRVRNETGIRRQLRNRLSFRRLLGPL
jgi:anti-sigma factor RsiW